MLRGRRYTMSIVRWFPVKELEEMRRNMERLFGGLYEPSLGCRRWWPKPSETSMVVPKIDIYDRKDEVVVKAELPSVEKNDIDLTITKDSITIKGEIKREEEVKEVNYYASERSYGSFKRMIALPVEVESEKAKAAFKNGILEIVLPKKEEAKPKEIKIEVS